VGQQFQEKAGEMGQRLREGYDSTREELARRYRRTEGSIARNPAPSVLLGFGVGFGLGLVLTAMLSEPEESWSNWAERRSRKPIRKARESLKSARDVADQAQDQLHHLPEVFGHLADSIRDLPQMIARHLPGGLGGR